MGLPVSSRCLYINIFFLAVVFVAAHGHSLAGHSLASASRGSSLVAALWLFTSVASLVVDHAGV